MKSKLFCFEQITFMPVEKPNANLTLSTIWKKNPTKTTDDENNFTRQIWEVKFARLRIKCSWNINFSYDWC